VYHAGLPRTERAPQSSSNDLPDLLARLDPFGNPLMAPAPGQAPIVGLLQSTSAPAPDQAPMAGPAPDSAPAYAPAEHVASSPAQTPLPYQGMTPARAPEQAHAPRAEQHHMGHAPAHAPGHAHHARSPAHGPGHEEHHAHSPGHAHEYKEGRSPPPPPAGKVNFRLRRALVAMLIALPLPDWIRTSQACGRIRL